MQPASLDWLHPHLKANRGHILTANALAEEDGPCAGNRDAQWRAFRDTHIKKYAPGVYSMPYLNPRLCRYLRAHLLNLGYSPNDEEEPEAQINECVLNHMHPELFTQLNGVWMLVMPAIANLLLQLEVQSCLSIQGAVYSPDGTKETAWHQDIDSEFTAVVALSDPSEFIGGGTDVWRDNKQYNVPPLSVGHAMIFAGRTTLHRGCEVIYGERHLLVHWCNQSLSNLNMH
jgi:hypothetical protein